MTPCNRSRVGLKAGKRVNYNSYEAVKKHSNSHNDAALAFNLRCRSPPLPA
jgi:hypothetical protein